HVYGDDVACAVLNLLGQQRFFGQAFNLSADHSMKLPEILEFLAVQVGAASRIQSLPAETFAQAQIPLEAISPFSQVWMSCLSPSLAIRELGFRPTPFSEYAPSIVASFLAHAPKTPPENYSFRGKELALAS